MAVVRYTGTAPVAGAIVNVFFPGTQAPATIYDDLLLTPKSNPFTADLLTGAYTFCAEQQAYDIVLGETGAAPVVPVTGDEDYAIVVVDGVPIAATIKGDAFGLTSGAGI